VFIAKRQHIFKIAASTSTLHLQYLLIITIMPAASDILQFFRGQLFETPSLPNTSFAGKTVVITGANQGLGYECAKQL
jgi:hypothetical protein